jgi:Cytochrome c bacterial
MKRAFIGFVMMAIAIAVAMPAGAQEPAANNHTKYFDHYEGTKTCLKCHRKEAENFFYSQHYQWQGQAPQIVNAKGKLLGKMNTINDFCTNPKISWIGLVKNSRGEVISRGCSACHAGSGLLPSDKLSEEQLQNVDCLICHATGYRRDLYERPGGGWEWKPILWQNQEGLDSVAKRISLPERIMCMRCHSASGGGPNFKRGDLEYKLTSPEREYDVHMATDGANMQCLACHQGSDHRVRGRGTDLSGTDMPGKNSSCDNKECHGPAPHQNADLNRHVARVYCTTCHIPTFAKSDKTDMVRDWSKPAYNKELDKYTASITFARDVKPVYTWYNGQTYEQLLGQPVRHMKDGTVGIMIPQGTRHDPNARIYAFKLHQGKMPVLEGKNWIIPIQVENFFSKGAIDPAVKGAAHEMYGVENASYRWVPTTRYMGIFHGVPPATKALQCVDCHGPDGRMDWKALGYKTNPNPMPAVKIAAK